MMLVYCFDQLLVFFHVLRYLRLCPESALLKKVIELFHAHVAFVLSV